MAIVFRRSSYYSRVIVPADHCVILQRRQILKTLQSTVYRDATARAAVWEGRLNMASLEFSMKKLQEALEKIQRPCL